MGVGVGVGVVMGGPMRKMQDKAQFNLKLEPVREERYGRNCFLDHQPELLLQN